MAQETTENLELKNYLLGTIENGEVEKIEERLLTDDVFFEDLLATEEDLIQDYIDGHLNKTEKTQFETHFLISEERQKKLDFAQTLRKNLDARLAEAEVEKVSDLSEQKDEPSPPKFFEGLFGFFSLSNPIPAFILIIAFIGAIGLAVLYFSDDGGQTALEKEFAELNKKDFSNPEKFDDVPGLNLIPGSMRNSSEIKKLNKENLKDRVFFRLALPVRSNSEKGFAVKLIRSGEVLFTQTEISTYKNQDGEEIRLLIPASLLETGKYRIEVNNGETAESDYSFSVE